MKHLSRVVYSTKYEKKLIMSDYSKIIKRDMFLLYKCLEMTSP